MDENNVTKKVPTNEKREIDEIISRNINSKGETERLRLSKLNHHELSKYMNL